MLKEKLQSAVTLISQVENNKKAESDHKYLASKNNIFFDNLKIFINLTHSYTLANKYFGFVLQADILTLINNLMQYSAAAFESKTVTNPNRFKEDVKKLSEAVSKAWFEFILSYNSEIDNGLRILSPLSENPAGINIMRTNLKKFSSWPLEQDNIDKYLLLRKNAEKLLENMEFDDEIRTFLEKVSRKEATLADLSQSVLEWIRKENLSQRLILSIR